jgi:hypothetical protein
LIATGIIVSIPPRFTPVTVFPGLLKILKEAMVMQFCHPTNNKFPAPLLLQISRNKLISSVRSVSVSGTIVVAVEMFFLSFANYLHLLE